MQGQSSHAPLASLAAHWHACKGDIPPPLVGASVTLVEEDPGAATSSTSPRLPSSGKVYLFGGRLVTTRRMVNDLYILDLSTLQWTRHGGTESAGSTLPQPRYFHSCDLWDRKLIVFGGMGYEQGSESELCVLNEIVAFDIDSQIWSVQYKKSIQDTKEQGLNIPEPRYAHLSSVTANSLVIVGGQDMANHYIESINVFDLELQSWTTSKGIGKQRGSYRSLAVSPEWTVDESLSGTHYDSREKASSPHKNGTAAASLLPNSHIDPLPTSKKIWDTKGKQRHLPIYVYTNYNFTDVKREMEVIGFEGEGDDEMAMERTEEAVESINVEDRSAWMKGNSLPPGLRFPMGAMLGNYLLISGTYLANTSQTFAIWALYLPKMTWSRLDVGPLLSIGSWNRGVLWPKQNRFLVFGHRERDLVSDYNHRQTNWDHILILELEAWGITQPPNEKVSRTSIELGLQKLTSSVLGSLSHSLPSRGLEEDVSVARYTFGGRGDFEIVCSDGMKIGCDRAVLERRWPWFATKMEEYRRETIEKAQELYQDRSKNGMSSEEFTALLESSKQQDTSDPRITPRQLHVAEPAPVMLALLIFLYTQCICTPLQRHPSIVAALLILSKVYNLEDLEVWAKHAAHVSLANDLSPPSTDVGTPTSSSPLPSVSRFALPPLERHRLAVVLYEAATLCGFEALQIRSLRTVMSIAKWIQRSSISSSKSSNAFDTTGEMTVHTPTTPSAFHDGITTSLTDMSIQGSPMRAPSTTTASPASQKRLSVGRVGTGGNTMTGGDLSVSQDLEEGSSSKVSRRPSKAERMLGMSGADIVASKGNRIEGNLGSGSLNSDGRAIPSIQGSRSASQLQTLGSSHSVSTAAAAALPPSNYRRPSAPASTISYNHSTPTNFNGRSASNSISNYSSTDHNSTVGRKRFSIFGRTSDFSKASTSEAGRGTGEASRDEGRNSSEYTPYPRSINRTDSNGGSTTNGEHQSLTSSEAATPSTNVSSLPPTAFSEKELKRMERETGKGKMTTLTRLKASALKSIDVSQSQSSLPTKINNNNNAPTTSQGSVKSNSTGDSSTATQRNLGRINSNSSGNGSGKLNDKELKALYSIWS